MEKEFKKINFKKTKKVLTKTLKSGTIRSEGIKGFPNYKKERRQEEKT
ncbi:MAG: hypothetical protein IJ181_13695 [Acidaminococcaceae bacterium]|nr:hypothetical protein [Acidaminococcaceae bacterium]